jgi:hypothetical protein
MGMGNDTAAVRGGRALAEVAEEAAARANGRIGLTGGSVAFLQNGEELDRRVQAIFRRPVQPQELADMVAAAPGSEVRISPAYDREGISVVASNKLYRPSATRTFFRAHGAPA